VGEVAANFKQHSFDQAKRKLVGKPFSSTYQPGTEAARAKRSVKEALMNAFDKLGNEAFFIELGRGSAEDRRCLAMILAKLLPIEVQGALDSTITVRVVSMLGNDEVEIQSLARTPLLESLPVQEDAGRDPGEGRG
jgi:hypothetical protein